MSPCVGATRSSSFPLTNIIGSKATAAPRLSSPSFKHRLIGTSRLNLSAGGCRCERPIFERLAHRHQRSCRVATDETGSDGRRFCCGAAARSTLFSSISFAEIRFGIERLADPVRRAELNDWLAHKLRPLFDQRVLPVSEDVMFKWRVLVEEGRRSGHTFSQPDLITAATALDHGLTVVSRDTSDFRRARVPVLNPWTEDAPL
jgi:toxin FitB